MGLKELKELTDKLKKLPKPNQTNEDDSITKWVKGIKGGQIEMAEESLHRFRIPIYIGLFLFTINLSYTVWLNYTDTTSGLLKEQIKISSELLLELQEAKQALFRIEENGLHVVVKDTLVD